MNKPLALATGCCCLIASACSTHIHKISEEGKSLCREQAAELSPGTSIDDRQRAYRSCIKTIDRLIEDKQEELAFKDKERLLLARKERLARQELWASPEERLAHCKIYREDVIRAEKERIRALGPKIMAERENDLTSAEKDEAISQYDQTVKSLDTLIPSKMRAGQPLLPDSVELFSRCLPSDFK